MNPGLGDAAVGDVCDAGDAVEGEGGDPARVVQPTGERFCFFYGFKV